MLNLKSRALIVFICLIFAACAAIGVMYLKTDRNPPTIVFSAPGKVNRETPLYMEIHGQSNFIPGKNLHIDAIQGNTEVALAPRASAFNPENGVLALQIFPADAPDLRDGEIIIEISARNEPAGGFLDGIFSSWTKRSFTISADLHAPTAEAAWSPPVLTRGGPGLLVITPEEKLDAARLIHAGRQYIIVPAANGKYAALTAFPQDLPLENHRLTLHMTDLSGNSSDMELVAQTEDFTFRADPIRLTDKFFKDKQQEFKDFLDLEASPLNLFLTMNREARAASYERLRSLCSGGSPQKLWRGAFLEMPGAIRRSEFADKRDYIYKGAIIDRQVHLGLDYASIAKDKIPAANDGFVVFAGYLGIHGNAVLIDHGLGLFSLYSHLSRIETETGQQIEKGRIIGRTGSTGMAGGDHLHFEILVNGVSVNPDFFFDAAWLEQYINAPLDALLETPHD